MTSVGYICKPTLEEFGPPAAVDPRPETCWRAGSDGRWVNPKWFYEALINGDVLLQDDWLQETFLDYLEKQLRIEFYNTETHEFFYAPVAKRGNLLYAIRKVRSAMKSPRPCPVSSSTSPFPGSGTSGGPSCCS